MGIKPLVLKTKLMFYSYKLSISDIQIHKYLYKAKGHNMKVLIETITNRKGYKNFNNINGLHEFLKQNHKKIKSYKILSEAYNGTFEDLIKEIMEKADLVSNMLLYAYFNMTDKSNKYNKLLKAAGLAAEIQGLIRGYVN